ncbi:xyloglucan endotransglucosylase/hydrolase protein 2-like [Fagus crenata]
MASSLLFLFAFLIATFGHARCAPDVPWSQNYVLLYGQDHTQLLNQEKEIQISLDQVSGTGFKSLKAYGSGFFGMRMKLPNKDTTGIITTFYLRSYTNNHDELDFEFLGGKGQNYLLHTNVFTNGQGGREQRISLWFDPTEDFHDYQLIWNQHQVVWFVDGTPIRVFKNNQNIGVSYPVQAMQIEASIWTAPWAGEPNWSQAPFQAHYQGFGIDGCPAQLNTIGSECSSSTFEWNGEKYWKLDPQQQMAYEDVRNKHMIYDYCTVGPKAPPECQSNQ